MSETELANAMTSADNNIPAEPIVTTPPETDNTDGNATSDSNANENVNDDKMYLDASACVKVYDLVMNNRASVTNWKHVVTTMEDGTAINNENVLVGVDNNMTLFSFDCKNLMIPSRYSDGITEIKVFVSGVVIKTATSSIYVSKNNIFIFDRNPQGLISDSCVYYKLRGGKIGYKVNRPAPIAEGADIAELTKLQFRLAGGRIYKIIENMSSAEEMKTAIYDFLNTKVVDLNYCIKIENICYYLCF